MPSNVAALLQELIRVPSVNPAGDPGTTGVGEKAMAEYVGDFLRGLGAEVELQEVLPDRPNVVARFPGDGHDKPRLLLAPHLDTVSVGGMTVEPFGGELRGGKIFGRGASDTKGTMAAMLWALKESDVTILSHEIWFAGLMGEEEGLHGSRDLAARTRFDFVVVGEPTGLQVVHATKGSTWMKLCTRGRAAHASKPHLGDNAIYKMTDVLNDIRETILPSLTAQHDPVLGTPTISVGTIRGGTKSNIVPDFCEVDVDMRTVPGQDVGAVEARLREICPDIEITTWTARPMCTPPDHPVIRILERRGAACISAPWFCDAAVFAEAGMPAVAVGPGSIDQAHTKDEFIAVADLEAGVDFFKRFFKELARR